MSPDYKTEIYFREKDKIWMEYFNASKNIYTRLLFFTILSISLIILALIFEHSEDQSVVPKLLFMGSSFLAALCVYTAFLMRKLYAVMRLYSKSPLLPHYMKQLEAYIFAELAFMIAGAGYFMNNYMPITQGIVLSICTIFLCYQTRHVVHLLKIHQDKN